MPTVRHKCCVDGCENPGTHNLEGLVTVERIGLEDSTVDSYICCKHLDMLSIGPPFVYLTITGYEGPSA